MNTEKNTKKDGLGDRMKRYEEVSRHYLMPRGYVCLRCDGRSFHNYTKGLVRPFDISLMEDMDMTAIYLCENVQGAVVGYVQSDEISIVTSNFGDFDTQTFFDGNVQKISSIVASMATSRFIQLRAQKFIEKKSLNLLSDEFKLAAFDCRCWNVPNHWEAYNTLLWRQQDAIRNSVSAVAQYHFSHKELQGKSTPMMHEMIHQAGKNWATDYSDGEKNGRLIVKESYETSVSIPDVKNFKVNSAVVERTRWVVRGAWKFTEDKEKLLAMIPMYAS